MWTLVEQGNDEAIKEFSDRHPECRAELMRRAAMVGDLKRANPLQKSAANPPPFRPRIPYGAPAPASRFSVAAIVFAVAALGLGSFLAGRFLFPAPVTASQALPPKAVHSNPLSAQGVMPQQPPLISREEPVQTPTNELAVPETPSRTVTLKISNAPLLSVLEMIGAQTSLKIIPAPGMFNPDIDAEYTNLTAMQVLEDLGQHHAFTAFDQGDGSIIVVPAVQQDSASRTRLGG